MAEAPPRCNLNAPPRPRRRGCTSSRCCAATLRTGHHHRAPAMPGEGPRLSHKRKEGNRGRYHAPRPHKRPHLPFTRLPEYSEIRLPTQNPKQIRSAPLSGAESALRALYYPPLFPVDASGLLRGRISHFLSASPWKIFSGKGASLILNLKSSEKYFPFWGVPPGTTICTSSRALPVHCIWTPTNSKAATSRFDEKSSFKVRTRGPFLFFFLLRYSYYITKFVKVSNTNIFATQYD